MKTEYQPITINTSTDGYRFLIKPITETEHKYHIIPIDHIAAHLIDSYDRLIVKIQEDQDRNILDQIQSNLKLILPNQTISLSNVNINWNDQTNIEPLIDFIGTGNDITRDTKKSFLKQYISQLES